MKYRVDYRSPRIRKGNWRKGSLKFDSYEDAQKHKEELEEMVKEQGSDLTFKVVNEYGG